MTHSDRLVVKSPNVSLLLLLLILLILLIFLIILILLIIYGAHYLMLDERYFFYLMK